MNFGIRELGSGTAPSLPYPLCDLSEAYNLYETQFPHLRSENNYLYSWTK